MKIQERRRTPIATQAARGPTGGSVDAIAHAFGWLATNNVFVINVSLVGPPNRILERIVERSLARGYTTVRGISFTAPVVAGLLALRYDGAADKALAHLAVAVEDLGPQGKDPVYGIGLVGRDIRIAPSAVGAR